MKDNWTKLQKHKVDHRLSDTVDRKLSHLKKVINDPDSYNTNIASKEKVISLEQQLEELLDRVDKIEGRLDGMNYLINQIVKNFHLKISKDNEEH